MFIQSILDLFGFATETSYNFLTQDLMGFAPGVALAMENINGGLQAFSYALLVILTLWNVVRTAGSYVELKRPEHVFKLFLRFILTKYSMAAGQRYLYGNRRAHYQSVHHQRPDGRQYVGGHYCPRF